MRTPTLNEWTQMIDEAAALIRSTNDLALVDLGHEGSYYAESMRRSARRIRTILLKIAGQQSSCSTK